MAKKILSYAFSGQLDFGKGTITETKKDETKVYPLMKLLEQFDGAEIDISFKEFSDVEQVGVVD